MTERRDRTTVVSYVDTQAFAQLAKRQGYTDADEATLRQAVADGRLAVILSVLNLEETLALAFREPQQAAAELRLILDLADPVRLVKPPFMMLTEDIVSYGRALPPAPRYLPLEPAARAVLERMPLEAAARTLEMLELIRLADEQKEAFRSGLVERQRDLPKGKPTFQEHWDVWVVDFAEDLARRAAGLTGRPDLVDAVRERGAAGLYKVPSLSVAIGANISLAYSQLYEGRKPRGSDSRDMHHAIMGTAAASFVTHDGKFGRVLRRIPGLPFEVLTLRELLARVSDPTFQPSAPA
jgi:hypothetical protein